MLSALLSIGQPRPRFNPELRNELRGALEADLASTVARLGAAMWVTKHDLAQVHTCEGHYRAQKSEPFGWNSRNAEGTLVHKAIELSIATDHEHAALDLVDHAIASLLGDEGRRSPRPWLMQAGSLELAELRARANDTVVRFRECWPPLRRAWSPRTETGIGVDLCDSRVALRGKVDLVLGVARADQARCLIVDLKTGRPHAGHLDDLRFYALIQTLRVGVPPFRVASYYLDTATFQAEDVTEATLHAALRRTADGVVRMVELTDPAAAPVLTPGPTCGWCRLRSQCPESLSS